MKLGHVYDLVLISFTAQVTLATPGRLQIDSMSVVRVFSQYVCATAVRPICMQHGDSYGKLVKRNANGFSLTAIVNVCLSLCRRHGVIFYKISRKLLKLATSKFTTAQPSIVFTFSLEMTSPATSGRQ